MRKYTCLIVDDEPIAREIVQTYCAYLPQLKVFGSCANALEAKIILQENDIDILFLDINMPVLDGIAFLKTLKNQPQVIFTTAYKEYASDAFDLSVCDYLLKPFSLERFIVAIDKAIDRLHERVPINQPLGRKEEDFIFIRTSGKIYKIQFVDLLYAEASGNNTRLVTSEAILLPAMTLTNVEVMLPPADFLRTHRSFIVNKSKITHIEGNRVYIGKIEIPIGSNYREGFLKNLGF
ncbi:LytR/AlgR family response regulator transcription factor [Daejeonella lutea]|uniref:Two component transcriptional regulator, LytTR family n=1 Tax=Daejeonella lutea TaxID=572036 RepID=A0A1T5EDN6_9SPHI|nr:LytTR family DNA-binding domain-containing protein [Daejeonella lutea]SKB81949.1 two component transcriptional regulator, LytTR family [Daejeonella lutea]